MLCFFICLIKFFIKFLFSMSTFIFNMLFCKIYRTTIMFYLKNLKDKNNRDNLKRKLREVFF